MSEFSRETLLNIIETDHVQCGEASALASMALAAMDSEPVEMPLDYLQGHKDGLEWAAQLAEANHPETGDWLYDDPIELAKAIRKGPDMPPAQPVEDSETDCNERQLFCSTDTARMKKVISVSAGSEATPLYRHAQPAPVVPEDFDFNRFNDVVWLECVASNPHMHSPTTSAIARVALELNKRSATMEAEPDRNPVLAYADSYRDMAKQGVESVPIWSVITDLERNIAPLYRHAQPVPVVSADLLHTAASAIEDLLTTKDRMGVYVCFDLPFRLRSAANAQPAPAAPVCTCPSGDGSLRWPCPVHPGNSPVIPDGWTCNDKANAALMMLDRIETVDPVDDDRIDGIKRIVRELAAAPHDTPALNSVQSVDSVADRWIPVSERVPVEFEAVIAFDGDQVYGEAMYSSDDGFTIDGYEPCDRLNLQNVTHWMPLPAGPQEVK